MIAAILREAALQSMLLALRLMIPVCAVGAVAVIIGFYTVLGAACFYAASWLVQLSITNLITP
jgi:hypothetical protein